MTLLLLPFSLWPFCNLFNVPTKQRKGKQMLKEMKYIQFTCIAADSWYYLVLLSQSLLEWDIEMTFIYSTELHYCQLFVSWCLSHSLQQEKNLEHNLLIAFTTFKMVSFGSFQNGKRVRSHVINASTHTAECVRSVDFHLLSPTHTPLL